LIALEGKETDEAVSNHVQGLATQMKTEATLLRVITWPMMAVGGLGKPYLAPTVGRKRKEKEQWNGS
jgi:hypothetical protein